MKALIKKQDQTQATVRNMTNWWRRLINLKSRPATIVYILLITVAFSCSVHHARANQLDAAQVEDAKINQDTATSSKSVPANHRSDTDAQAEIRESSKGRQSRQYDGSLGVSGTGSYASISGDGAYVAQMPVSAASYGPGSNAAASSYASDLGGPYHSSGGYHSDPISMGRGYPMGPAPMGHPSPGSFSPSMGPLSSMFSPSSGGLLSSSMFPLMAKGFDVSEIVCTAIAVAIGAVIVGAPFILIYLFIMNQMNGGGSQMGPSGGAISLTGQSSNTNVSGRKKRHTSLPEALFKQLSPLVNSEQVANTFKTLINSMAKYQM